MEGEKAAQMKNYSKPWTEKEHTETTDRLMWLESKRKERIRNMVDEKMAGLFKPKIMETKRGGSRSQRKKLRKKGEWFGYKSKPSDRKKVAKTARHQRNKSALQYQTGEQDPEHHLGLYQRHDMSKKYEQELHHKFTNTLFSESKGQFKILTPRSKSQTHQKEYRKVYNERKKAAKRKQERIKKKRQQLKELKRQLAEAEA
jgi:hypothetical protein